MGLRSRLNLLLALIFCATLAIAVTYLLADARRAVIDELHASTELASTLIQGILNGPLSLGEEASIETMLEQLEAMGSIRHLRINLVPATREIARSVPRTEVGTAGVPAWFSRLVRPQPEFVTQTARWRQGSIVIAADPDDEIAEAWRETRTTLRLLLAVFAGAMVVIFMFLGRALRPLKDVSRALEGIEHGDFAARIPPAGLPDIDGISERFNHMAEALARSQADNAMLARRSLAIQEEERRHLAHELHDEMGQSITAIKALAVSIRERAQASDATLAERAATITDVSSDIYARVRRMMTRLHPVVLDELGLAAALGLMVDDWNAHHEECFCRYVAARDLPMLTGAARIGLYRIAQEALTNIAKHAHASAAEITLGVEPADPPCVLLEVSDNGAGFEAMPRRSGLGLLGIRERVVALGGSFELAAALGTGVRMVVRVPLTRAQTMAERTMADDAHTPG